MPASAPVAPAAGRTPATQRTLKTLFTKLEAIGYRAPKELAAIVTLVDWIYRRLEA